jgi:hypothetical protein
MESRYSCKSFPAKKLNRRSLAVIVARISMAAATTNIFSLQWLAEEFISLYASFFVTEAFERRKEFF